MYALHSKLKELIIQMSGSNVTYSLSGELLECIANLNHSNYSALKLVSFHRGNKRKDICSKPSSYTDTFEY